MKKVELLAPAGDFECVKAAVQSGADCIYFGCSSFNARASAKNFNIDEMKEVIDYCSLRNVKTNLTLNTLIKNSEFNDALLVAKKAYEFGIDAIIVQDLGLAKFLLKNFKGLPIHASTQMTVHNLEGALYLENLGFKRIVLSRELSINEIAYICRNTKVEIEVFIHGALCISYSGQCLFSSIVGGRSGNRGRCAQPCRLPYSLVEESPNSFKKIDSGYLLSTKDVCALEYIPDLINAGVSCFKIEGRMKSPEYVAIVTSIYRKYIDLHYSKVPYSICKNDITNLLQVFNRGGFSNGHLSNEENRNLIFKEKQNHMGLFLGTIYNYNKNKGIVTLCLNVPLCIGDTISFEKESSSYKISELMDKNNKNIPMGEKGTIVCFGRMKGNISVGDKVYKLSDKLLNSQVKKNYINAENVKHELYCNITLRKDFPIVLNLHTVDDKYNISVSSDICPETAIKQPITKEKIINQLSKTGDYPFEFKDIKVELEDNLFIPKISILNELRRNALKEISDLIISKKHRTINLQFPTLAETSVNSIVKNRKISLLFQILDVNMDYSSIRKVDDIYIPFKYFLQKKYKEIILQLGKKGKLFIYMPTIIKNNYKNLFFNNISEILKQYFIKGFVISNLGDFILLKDYFLMQNLNDTEYEFIGNYTLNIFNNYSISHLKNTGVTRITPSPELNNSMLVELTKTSEIPCELMVYGNVPIMNLGYCLLGKSNKCYPTCTSKCKNINNKYHLIDRLNFKFRVIPDNLQTITSIYNSKITSFDFTKINTPYLRINFLEETIDDMNAIIDKITNGEKIQGREYTNGNFNKDI
ncbi:MAG: DUF3656 domain-containing protein [Clostridia bacterium]|nr:DUF3656 domain-containing protein [Clostridia bacterium]